MPRHCRLLCLTLATLPLVSVFGYETDQYNHRHRPLNDSLEVLDLMVNDALTEVAAEWQGGRNDQLFARKVYRQLGGLHWVDRIERWSMTSPLVDRIPEGPTIYSGAPLAATKVIYFFGVGATLQVDGVRLGSDKLGHFFSQGFKLFRRQLRGRDEAQMLQWASRVEKWLFGQWTTGVYSNADLVANYEGYLFYRGLFEDDIVPGRQAIIEWQDGQPMLRRAFSWRDHVNDYWDEALNPSFLGRRLQRYIETVLPSFCADYRASPDTYVPQDGHHLAERYRHIGLRPAIYNRIDQVCRESS